MIMNIDVNTTNRVFVKKLKWDDENILGINIKITNGLTIPPVKYNKKPNWKISITKNKNADLSFNWLCL